jgi:hypothetical protein
MATVIKRQIRATPHRTASETWLFICKLLTPNSDSSARKELEEAIGVMGHLIASESFKNSPLIVYGIGPRVRIYCLYDEDAITGEDATEDALSFDATDGDWYASAPSHEDDLDWVKTELNRKSKRISARGEGEEIQEDSESPDRNTSASVNLDAFLRP